MPICGSLPVPPGSVERVLPNGLCVVTPSWTPLATQPIYQQGGFISTNPNALVTREFTGANGRTVRQYHTAAAGFIGEICIKNCGAGSGFFGLGGEAANIARGVGSFLAQLLPALTPIAPFVAAGSALASNVERSQAGMGLNLSGILGATGSILSGANLGSYSGFGQLFGGGLQIASAALAPQPAAAPIYGVSPYSYPVQTVAARSPSVVAPMAGTAVAAGAAAMAGIVSKEGLKILLAKVAAALGRKGITLQRVVSLVRSWGRFLGPAAVATSLGLEVAELAILLSASASRKRRRMNPANVHALRRATRRIKSFQRLASHTHVAPRRRSSVRGAACGTCRKSPCRC